MLLVGHMFDCIFRNYHKIILLSGSVISIVLLTSSISDDCTIHLSKCLNRMQLLGKNNDTTPTFVALHATKPKYEFLVMCVEEIEKE